MNSTLGKAVVLFSLVLGTIWVSTPLLRDLLLAGDEARTILPRGELADFEKTAIDLFETASPSVVYIFTQSRKSGDNYQESDPSGTGSGFIWDRAGHIVTNFHVVQGADRISVQLGDGVARSARLVGAAPDYDLAVLKMKDLPSQLKPLSIGSSGDLRIGQAVFAIGNPFGLNRSLSTGVVSALNRHLPTASGREIHGVIQSDAAINPGNSGGPLLDSAGRLIGVNTAIISKSGSSAGIGFSVPVDVVNQVIPELIKSGKYPRPGIGIAILDEQISARLGAAGVVIRAVFPGSEAERAGLRGIDDSRGLIGDIITQVDGSTVRTISDLARALGRAGIGQNVELTVQRDGRSRTVKIKVTDIS